MQRSLKPVRNPNDRYREHPELHPLAGLPPGQGVWWLDVVSKVWGWVTRDHAV